MIKLVGNKIKFLNSDYKRWTLLSVTLALFIFLPIATIAYKTVFNNSISLKYLADTLLLEYSLNTIYLVILSSFFSLIFGIFPAWFISMYKFKGRKFYDLILFLPLAIPTYIMAFTYGDVLSYTGPIQSFIRNNYSEIYYLFNKDFLQIEILAIILGLALYPYIYSVSRVSFSLIGSNYLDLSKTLGLFAKLQHTIRPGSDFYLVYTHNWTNIGDQLFNFDLVTKSKVSALKINYTFRF